MSENGIFENTIFENTMFADTLISSSSAERSRRGWTTLTSLALQVLLAGLLLLLPLLRPEALPLLHRLSTPVSLGRPQAEPPASTALAASVSHSNFVAHILMAPTRIPVSVALSDEDSGPPNVGNAGSNVAGIPGTGDPNGLPISIAGGTRPVLPVPPPAVVRPLRVSNISEGNLIHRVQPEYPPLARAARIQGQVVLQALISKEGTIEHLRVLTGHPMLVQAAEAAVSQWRYRPYYLNHEPVEVETQITVNFFLDGN